MNNLFKQGNIPIPTPRPYPVNPMPLTQPPQQALPPQQAAPQTGLLGNLMRGPQNPQMRNLMIAAGTAMANGGRGFGQTLAGLDAQGQERAQQAAQANLTAQWLRGRGADPQLVQMAQQGMGGQALQLWKASQPAEVKKPSSIQEYEFAKSQGFDGTYMDYRQANKGGTTINNMGNIPAGYELFVDPQTGSQQMRPIPGSPDYVEAQQLEQKRELGQEKKATAAGVVVQDIDRALQKIEAGDDGFLGAFGMNSTTGLVGSVLKNIPQTDAHDTMRLMDTIKANSGFDKLQSMRDSSPTGGALGAINNTELGLLQAAIGNLELSQDAEQLKDNLRRVKNIYLDIIHGPNAGPPRERLGFEGGADGWQDLGNGVRIREKR